MEDEQKQNDERTNETDDIAEEDNNIVQPVSQERKDVTEPDGPIKESEEQGTSSPLIEEKPQSLNEAKQEKPKYRFGSNSKITLFKRRSSTKDKQGKDKAEAPAKNETAEKPFSSDSADVENSSITEGPAPHPLRSRSATCNLL